MFQGAPLQMSSREAALGQELLEDSTFQNPDNSPMSPEGQGRHPEPFQRPTRASPSFQRPSGDASVMIQPPARTSPSFQQLCTSPEIFQDPAANSTPFQQPCTSPEFQNPARNSTPFQQPCTSPEFQNPARSCTPFQQPCTSPEFQHQSTTSTSFYQPCTSPEMFHHPATTSPSFQQPCISPEFQHQSMTSPSFQQPCTSPEFQNPLRNSTPFQQPCTSPEFQHHSTTSPHFQQPCTSTEFQHPARNSPSFQQPCISPEFQNPAKSCTPFQQPNNSSPEVFQHPATTSPSFQQSCREAPSFHHPQMRNPTDFQQTSRKTSQCRESSTQPCCRQGCDSSLYSLAGRQPTALFHPSDKESAQFREGSKNLSFHHQGQKSSQIHFEKSNAVQSQLQNRDCVQYQYPNGDPTPFSRSNGNATDFRLPYQQPSQDSPSPQLSRSCVQYEEMSRDIKPFELENLPYSQVNGSSPSSFGQTSMGSSPMQQQSNGMHFQQQEKDSTLFYRVNRAVTPFHQVDGDSKPAVQQLCANTAVNAATLQPMANQVSSYPYAGTKIPEQLPTTLVKTEPGIDDSVYSSPEGQRSGFNSSMLYGSNGDMPHKRNLAQQEGFTQMRSYGAVAESHSQPRFGVQFKDLMLRNWASGDAREAEGDFGNEKSVFRRPSFSSLPHGQQKTVMQAQAHIQIQGQLSYHEVPSGTNPALYGSPVTGGSQSSTYRAPIGSVSAPDVDQARRRGTRPTAFETLPSAPVRRDQSWWQQSRMAGFERMISG